MWFFLAVDLPCYITCLTFLVVAQCLLLMSTNCQITSTVVKKKIFIWTLLSSRLASLQSTNLTFDNSNRNVYVGLKQRGPVQQQNLGNKLSFYFIMSFWGVKRKSHPCFWTWPLNSLGSNLRFSVCIPITIRTQSMAFVTLPPPPFVTLSLLPFGFILNSQPSPLSMIKYKICLLAYVPYFVFALTDSGCCIDSYEKITLLESLIMSRLIEPFKSKAFSLAMTNLENWPLGILTKPAEEKKRK